MSDDVFERLGRAFENNPNADPKRLLWLADADPSYLEAAEAIVDGEDPIEPDTVDELSSEDLDRAPSWNSWASADFEAPTPGIWPEELLEREQWMGHVEKKPFAPWADRDHPEADADQVQLGGSD